MGIGELRAFTEHDQAQGDREPAGPEQFRAVSIDFVVPSATPAFSTPQRDRGALGDIEAQWT